tara:strand:+ start:4847 stop:9592 length:4746 start_codon:yes stop_codon:yes gene_type:complete
MAKQRKRAQKNPTGGKTPPMRDISSIDTSLFTKGMVKDMNASFAGKQNWLHARNAANNSEEGDVGLIGNEPANFSCAEIPYTIIGAIHLYQDKWVLFSTDNTNSEIGIFDDSECVYEEIINDPCLEFNKKYLIVGAAKENFDCTWQVYWDDALNPSRTLNIDNIPWIQVQNSAAGDPCVTYVDTTRLDCEKIRLAPLLDTPCVTIRKGDGGGQLRNGTYQVYVAYTINEQKIGDYIGISNTQSFFDHSETDGSLQIEVTNLDREFDYYEVVILSNTKSQIQAKRVGYYSTEQSRIFIDYIDNALPVVPVELIPLRNPAYEKSDKMYVVNDWLIRSGPTEQFDFNYQPLANKIKTKWTSARYSPDYYYKGGNKPTLLRDEIYSLFVRFIYNTGERSSSYHIPGRGGTPQEKGPAGLRAIDPNDKYFTAYNTASMTNGGLQRITDDGGIITSEGYMAYWESSEKYPNKPEIWEDLCGEQIRHHKMPYEGTDWSCELSPSDISSGVSSSITTSKEIRIIGLRCYNIAPPVYNDGTVIPNITGYEILIGSREGQKSILSKGIFRNLREYELTKGSDTTDRDNTVGYYPNFPYNDLGDDVYHARPDIGVAPAYIGNTGSGSSSCDATASTGSIKDSGDAYPPLKEYAKDKFTFHSPDLMFKKPFLNADNIQLYGEVTGTAAGRFQKSEFHPQAKLLKNAGLLIAGIFGVGYALQKMRGRTDDVVGIGKKNNIGLMSAPFPANSFVYGTGVTAISAANVIPTLGSVAMTTAEGVINSLVQALIDELVDTSQDFLDVVSGGAIYDKIVKGKIDAGNVVQSILNGYMGPDSNITLIGSDWKEVPGFVKIMTGVLSFMTFATEGAQQMIDLIYEFLSPQDFMYKYNSHGFYGQYTGYNSNMPLYSTQNRSKIEDQAFINNTLTKFGRATINNLFRPQTVAIGIDQIIDDPIMTVVDKSDYESTLRPTGSRHVIGQWRNGHDAPTKIKNTPIACHYGALKFDLENQYGQLDGIKQIPVRGCVKTFDPIEMTNPENGLPVVGMTLETDDLFPGDCYVNRYTEKTIMPLFWEFLKGQPDLFPFDYSLYQNLPLVRYWYNSEKYQVAKFTEAFSTLLSGGFWGNNSGQSILANAMPNDQYYLDRGPNDCSAGSGIFNVTSSGSSFFNIKNAFSYAHCNGIQDFYVESEINLASRDWEEQDTKRHYDWYTFGDTQAMFHADNIKAGNFYRYDYSLSVSRFPNQMVSWGNMQPRDYNPKVAEECFSYYPKRLIYSLQAKLEAKKDFWRVFLPNNYKDFKSKVNVIKPINKSGALVMFPYLSPQMFQGIDQLQTDLGTKLTIGDGGLFGQPFQNIVNSDMSNEYGSCENERSVINTPSGVFFISQAQGKIFNYSGKLENIANRGMKWWFNKYLPSQLMKQFPELEGNVLSDNPVVGIGCQSIYDINDDIVYFAKKDYICNPDTYIEFPEPNTPGNQQGRLPDYDGIPICECIEYNAELGFVFNQTKCGGNPTLVCPDGFIYNELTGNCEAYECVPGVTVDPPPPPPEGGYCCCEFPDGSIDCAQVNTGDPCIEPCQGQGGTSLPYTNEPNCLEQCGT